MGLQRPVPFTEKKQEHHVDLVRGSSLFFLTQENQRASSKLGAMNTQLGEVELELNGLKNVLFQAENQVMRNKTDLANMQHRYDTVQMQIEKSQQEIASEEHKLLLARLSVPTAVCMLLSVFLQIDACIVHAYACVRVRLHAMRFRACKYTYNRACACMHIHVHTAGFGFASAHANAP